MIRDSQLTIGPPGLGSYLYLRYLGNSGQFQIWVPNDCCKQCLESQFKRALLDTTQSLLEACKIVTLQKI